MTMLGSAIDGVDMQRRNELVGRVEGAIDGYGGAEVLLVCLYFALVATMRLDGNLDELLDDLPRLGRSVVASQMDSVTRQ